MVNKIRKGSMILIIGVSVIVGIVFAVLTQTPIAFLFVTAIGLFFGTLILIPIFLVTSANEFVDILISQVRRHPGIMGWSIIFAGVIFLSLNIIWGFSIYSSPAEATIRLMKSTLFYEILSVFVLILALVILFISRFPIGPSLSSSLANQITQELILQSPQAAIEHSFTFFEEYLRNRLGVGAELFGESLINEAFGQPNGKLTYGATDAEQRGMRNLIAGTYATFRNPYKHRIVKDDERTTFAIITLVDLLVQLVDKSQDRSLIP